MKILKKLFAAALLLTLVAAVTGFVYYYCVTADTALDTKKLAGAGNFIEIYDKNDAPVAEIGSIGEGKKVRISELPKTAKSAFVAAEDKKFYKHHGLDYARILKATIKNISARSFKQGASTISQQLIKNTHLTNEKTLKRKLKEIKLTRALEKKFTKDEILEMYLNTIYFGHNCYGIAGASDYYFSKPAQELTPAESAMLAAIIRSPNNYSPFVSAEKCLSVRNSVLKRMREQGYLNESEYENAVSAPLPEQNANNISSQTYLQCVTGELESLRLTDFPYSTVKGLKIYTYLDSSLQEYIENLSTGADRSGKSIVIEDNDTYGIVAYYTTEGNIKRQPGSLFKPLAVYAPAIEENQISPCTPIADERTTFGNYAPSNYKDEYHGYVSTRYALSHSLNIPAIKILSTLGIDNSKKYLDKMGLKVSEKDQNLALALGGTNDEYTLTDITAAYALFANGGNYSAPHFIRKIIDTSGNIIYEHLPKPKHVFSEDTAYLINDILKDAAKNGTAKKLASLHAEICAKTGTVGNDSGNTDAYTIAYTGSHSIGVWMGNADRTKTDITGGGLPCHYAMLIYKQLYRTQEPRPLPVSDNIEAVSLDRISYEKYHTVLAASPDQPRKYTFTELFRKCNIPTETSRFFSDMRITAKISCIDNSIYIDLCEAEYFNIIVKRVNNKNSKTIYDGVAQTICDDTISPGIKYTYSITPYCMDESGKITYGKTISLPSVLLRDNAAKQSDYGKWWNSFQPLKK